MSEKSKFALMVCFISLLGFMGGTIYLAVLPELSHFFHVSSKVINFSLTIYFLGFIFGTALSGPFSEVYGRLNILSFFLILFIASSFLCGFSTSISWFLIGRFLEGLGNAGGPIIAIALVADRYEGSEYYKSLSSILIMMGLGGGIAPILGSLILDIFMWRVVFYFLAAMGILALGLIFYARMHSQFERKENLELFSEYHFFIKHPLFRYYCLMIGVLYGAFYAFVIISPYIFRVHYGWKVIDFAWVGLLLALGEGLGIFLDEELIEKIGTQKILLGGLTTVTIALFMLSFFKLPQHGIWLLLMALLFVVGANFISSCLIAGAVKMSAQFTGVASSLLNLSKITFAALALFLVLLLPETLETVNCFILGALLICIFGYLKIRHSF